MAEEQDDIAKLLADVQKVIRDNQLFLQTVMNDAEVPDDQEEQELEKVAEEEFEEL